MNPTIVELGLRSIFGRRRGTLLFVLPVLLVALAVLVRALGGDGSLALDPVQEAFGLRVVVPLVVLIATTGVIAPEIDDGSIVYLLAKPVSRYTVVLSKLAVVVACTVVFCVLPLLVSGFVLAPGDGRAVVAYGVGALLAGLAYSAVFLLLSVLTRHAAVWGLVYWLVWETLLGGLLSGVRWLSIQRWATSLVDALRTDGFSPSGSQVGPAYALVAALVVLAVGTVLAGRRLRSFGFTGDE